MKPISCVKICGLIAERCFEAILTPQHQVAQMAKRNFDGIWRGRLLAQILQVFCENYFMSPDLLMRQCGGLDTCGVDMS